jgi:hypothetical protein
MRNKYPGPCYQCGLTVAVETGHFERHAEGWRVKHANVPGDGRITCKMATEKHNAVVGSTSTVSNHNPVAGRTGLHGDG